MTGIAKQLSKYFIIITMMSIVFTTIISNTSINFFFSNYIKESRSRNDLKIVQYAEKVYDNNKGLDAQSLMIIMHYAYSENVTVRLRNMQDKVIWSSGAPETMHDPMELDDGNNSLAYRSYPFNYQSSKIGTIDVGRPKSIISSIEDKQFLITINSVIAVAFLFSILMANLLSSHISRKFLKPIYMIKENAKLIQKGKYKKLHEITTNTNELHDLSVSIKELAEKLEYQAVLRKRMTSDIAHELRTPVAIVQSHIEAFIDGVWEPKHDKLTIILNEISRLTKLIIDLSDLSGIESDEIKLHKSEINLSTLLIRILESFEPLFISKSIQIEKSIQSNIKLLGDADRLNQVFVNILSNAYKYTAKGGTVRVCLNESEGVIRVTVEDTGVGIPKEDIKHVFERFYRSDISRNRGTGGTGIGLTITKAYVEAHDGSIRIESEEGKGTKLIIEFMRLI
ncbi:MAG TPA: ATP-binding protein [Patescibacteria group bacterium]|nr:ATP-binding protein [Patescibacteria group bacterium]